MNYILIILAIQEVCIKRPTGTKTFKDYHLLLILQNKSVKEGRNLDLLFIYPLLFTISTKYKNTHLYILKYA